MKIDINTRDLAEIINNNYDLNGNKVDIDTTEVILDYLDDCGVEVGYDNIIDIIRYECTVYTDESEGEMHCKINDFIANYGYLWTTETHSEFYEDISSKNVLTLDRDRYLEDLIEAVEDKVCVIATDKAIIVLE